MADDWTIQKLLTWTRDWLTQKGSPSARIDAELLLGEVLKLRRLDLLLRFDQPVDKDELTAFKALIQRRSRGEPVAYILGRKGFYGIDLHVTPAVLVPRPETETLVDVALAFLRAAAAPRGPVLDLCTGSGALVLAIGHELLERPRGLVRPARPAPELPAEAGDAVAHAQALPNKPPAPPLAEPVARALVATDLSADALTVARDNATRLGLQVDFRQGDLLAALQPGERFAAIVSNPPYVLSERIATLDRDVRDFEPHLALDGGADGMYILQRLAAGVRDFLLPGGLLVVEVGSREQGLAFAELLATGGLPGAAVELVQGGPTSLVRVVRGD